MKIIITNYLVQQDFYDILTSKDILSALIDDDKIYMKRTVNEDEVILYPYNNIENLNNDLEILNKYLPREWNPHYT